MGIWPVFSFNTLCSMQYVCGNILHCFILHNISTYEDQKEGHKVSWMHLVTSFLLDIVHIYAVIECRHINFIKHTVSGVYRSSG